MNEEKESVKDATGENGDDTTTNHPSAEPIAEISAALSGLQEENGRKISTVNKRVDFDRQSIKRIETMMPIYSEELPENASQSEVFSYVVKKAVDSLFQGDFRSKINDL